MARHSTSAQAVVIRISLLPLVLLWVMFFCLSSHAVLHGANPTDLFDPKKAIEALPRELVKDMDVKSSKKSSAVEDGTKKLADTFNNKPATASFKISRMVANDDGYVVGEDRERVSVAGTEFTVVYEVYLSKSEGAKLRIGQKITVAGTAMVNLSGKPPLRIWVTLMGASLK